jgi:hypothetical protein
MSVTSTPCVGGFWLKSMEENRKAGSNTFEIRMNNLAP